MTAVLLALLVGVLILAGLAYAALLLVSEPEDDDESAILSSDLIREACELAWQRWPGERLFTYVADAKIRSVNPGYCFKKAGWRVCGRNADGRLTILEMMPAWAGAGDARQ